MGDAARTAGARARGGLTEPPRYPHRRTDYVQQAKDKTAVLTDMVADPTLPIARGVECPKCSHNQAVYQASGHPRSIRRLLHIMSLAALQLTGSRFLYVHRQSRPSGACAFSTNASRAPTSGLRTADMSVLLPFHSRGGKGDGVFAMEPVRTFGVRTDSPRRPFVSLSNDANGLAVTQLLFRSRLNG